jgi:hypothetical protein
LLKSSIWSAEADSTTQVSTPAEWHHAPIPRVLCRGRPTDRDPPRARGDPAADLSGKWSGHWESDKSGHKGPLHATFTRIDACHYRIVFHRRFWVVVPFRYGMTMDVTGQDGDTLILSGSHDLGPLFSTFHYCAEATSRDFVAAFQARRDSGRFVLTRVK